jgi:hypothetical protein
MARIYDLLRDYILSVHSASTTLMYVENIATRKVFEFSVMHTCIARILAIKPLKCYGKMRNWRAKAKEEKRSCGMNSGKCGGNVV